MVCSVNMEMSLYVSRLCPPAQGTALSVEDARRTLVVDVFLPPSCFLGYALQRIQPSQLLALQGECLIVAVVRAARTAAGSSPAPST